MILVGPSGCGKSTLLRMIVGLEDITSGDIVIGGKRVNDLAPRDRDLAMVFQNYALYPHLSVYENIAFPLRLAGGMPSRRSTEGARRACHAGARRAPASASRAISPAVSGSASRWAGPSSARRMRSCSTSRCRTSTRSCAARCAPRSPGCRSDSGITTVYVTHDQTEAMTLGDRVAVLKRGVLQQLATPRELYDGPANLFVAGFIGSPPMNFLPATVDGTEVELPFGTVASATRRRSRSRARACSSPASARALRRRGGVDSRPWSRHHVPRDGGRRRVARSRGLCLHPVRSAARGLRQLAQLERDLDGETLRTQLVVSLDANSKIVKGEEAEIWVDPGGCTCSTRRPGTTSRSSERVASPPPRTVRVLASTPNPAMLSLPWELPLAEWTEHTVPVPRGLSRHVVRVIRLDGAFYAVKETQEHLAKREYRMLRELARLGLPAVSAVAVVSGRPNDQGAALVTRHLAFALPYRTVFANGITRRDTAPGGRTRRAPGAAPPGRLLLGRRVALQRVVPPQRRRVLGVPRRRGDRRATPSCRTGCGSTT